jgi:hypothetical protein
VKNPYFDQFVVFGDRELAEGLFPRAVELENRCGHNDLPLSWGHFCFQASLTRALGAFDFRVPRGSPRSFLRIERKYFANDPGRLGRSVDRDAGAARLDAYLAFPCPMLLRKDSQHTNKDLLCRRQLAYGLHTGMFLPEHALAVSK